MGAMMEVLALYDRFSGARRDDVSHLLALQAAAKTSDAERGAR